MGIYSGNRLSAYRQAISDRLDGADVALFWKGRVALYVILKALDIGPGDEVIVPGFTCVVVPNAIIYTGATPVYVDIDREQWLISPEHIEKAITRKTKAIIAQNTFGLNAPLTELLEIGERYVIPIIDDCTHGFGGSYSGNPNGTMAHASFFSTQWNKPYSTGIGGMAATCNKELSQKLKEWEDKAIKPSWKDRKMLSLLLHAKKHMLNEKLYWRARNLYRWLSARNLVTGSSRGLELTGTEMPPDFLKQMSDVQAERGLRELEGLDKNLQHRKELAHRYTTILADMGIQYPFSAIPGHIFTKFPVLVKDRTAFMSAAARARIPLGDWFNSPIHPVQQDWHKWGYQPGSCPVAEKVAAHIVNLETSREIKEDTFQRIERFLRANSSQILHS